MASDVRAFALNCTLKPSPARSSTGLMLDHLAERFRAHDVEVDHQSWAVFMVAGEKLLDAVSHERHPPRARMTPRLANEGFAAMRPRARALETRRAVVDPPTRLLRDPAIA